MIQKILLSVLMLGGTYYANAQNPVSIKSTQKNNSQSAKQVATAQPEFKFFVKDNVHDYGTIPEGPKAVYEFQFINTGNAPLIITNAQASCGCTSPEFPREPIMPNKKGKIKVTYATEGRPGNFTKSVYITSNAQTNDGMGHYELKIKGIVLPAKK